MTSSRRIASHGCEVDWEFPAQSLVRADSRRTAMLGLQGLGLARPTGPVWAGMRGVHRRSLVAFKPSRVKSQLIDDVITEDCLLWLYSWKRIPHPVTRAQTQKLYKGPQGFAPSQNQGGQWANYRRPRVLDREPEAMASFSIMTELPMILHDDVITWSPPIT